MELSDLLHEEGQVTAVRMALVRAKSALNTASYDYAKAALLSAQDCYSAAMDEAPYVVAAKHMVESHGYINKSKHFLDVCLNITGLLLAAEQTDDPEIDGINADIKLENIDQPVIASMIAGAVSRLQMAEVMMPKSNAPGAKCVPEQLTGGPANAGPQTDDA